MANEPHRDIEKDLLAYKLRRHEQLGAPLELHPATRRMLQDEAVRVTSRPLLTSEEAAKNFVRSFVMSHQTPSFFARYRPQLLWGGGMFACLAVVLLVLRHDPQRTAQQRLFTDALPAPPVTPAPLPPGKPVSPVAANDRLVEVEKLSRARPIARADKDAEQEVKKLSGEAAAAPAPGFPNALGLAAPAGSASAPRRESNDAASLLRANVPPPAARQELSDGLLRSPAGMVASGPQAIEADLKAAEKSAKSELAESASGPLRAKSMRNADASPLKRDAEAKQVVPAELQPNSNLSAVNKNERPRAQVANGGVSFGIGSGAPSSPAAAPAQALHFTGVAAGEAGQVQQRFQQVDNLAGYRRNFNSPPVPPVMKEFSFQLAGDRVRIVDADGSTYEGVVVPVSPGFADGTREEQAAVRTAAKERDGSLDQAAKRQSGSLVEGYRFTATGFNRKLNQTVEFRGEWQPAAPPSSQPATPALQTTSLSKLALDSPVTDKRKLGTNTLADRSGVDGLRFAAPTPTAPSSPESPQGQITGRAIVGGRSEFDLKAVPK